MKFSCSSRSKRIMAPVIIKKRYFNSKHLMFSDTISYYIIMLCNCNSIMSIASFHGFVNHDSDKCFSCGVNK